MSLDKETKEEVDEIISKAKKENKEDWKSIALFELSTMNFDNYDEINFYINNLKK